MKLTTSSLKPGTDKDVTISEEISELMSNLKETLSMISSLDSKIFGEATGKAGESSANNNSLDAMVSQAKHDSREILGEIRRLDQHF
jgi:hypothetical protein